MPAEVGRALPSGAGHRTGGAWPHDGVLAGGDSNQINQEANKAQAADHQHDDKEGDGPAIGPPIHGLAQQTFGGKLPNP